MFVDTSGWASYADRSQPANVRAIELIRAACDGNKPVVTTSYVLLELTALLAKPLRMPRRQQIEFVSAIRKAAWVEVVPIDAELEAAAWHLWETRADKEWTLVDCSSFVVMQRRGIVESLTSDQHFEQAGFIRLLNQATERRQKPPRESM